jgi:hypothetical protein
MARYIVIHKGREEASQDIVVDTARAVRSSIPAGAKWLNSWYVPTTNRLICEWEAPDEDTIRSALKKALDLWPIEAMYPAVHVEPDWYK